MAFASKKKRAVKTFKQRVTEFWEWFPDVARRFSEAAKTGDPKDIVTEVSDFMSHTLPSLSWALGSGDNGKNSFTLTGEGLVPKQMLAEYWHSRAVEIEDWTFFASRQPSSAETLKSIAIGVSDQQQVDVENFMVETTVNEETQEIDITAWHPSLEHVDEDHHYQILFLLLDEALGEFGVQTWLGEIKVEPLSGQGVRRSLLDLPRFIEQVKNYHQWEKFPPLDTYSAYEVSEMASGPRSDTVAGSSCIPDVIFDYIENSGEATEDPLEDSGAEFVYLAIESSVFPEGSEVDARSTIEDQIDIDLTAALSGWVVGGATGSEHSYIDILLLDGAESRRLIEKTMRRLKLSDKCELINFA